MKTSDIIGIKEKRAETICNELLESCKENEGKEFSYVMVFAINKYKKKEKELMYALFALGYMMGDMDAKVEYQEFLIKQRIENKCPVN